MLRVEQIRVAERELPAPGPMPAPAFGLRVII
jgi:hypothetical protein